MAEFVHVRRINVSLWGERVGTIIPSDDRRYYAFRYEKNFLKSGIEISPLMMPLRTTPYLFTALPVNEYCGLPPVFADSLPDAFGNSMINRWLTGRGLAAGEATALDRLAYIGKRSMGALGYEPERGPGGKPTALDLRRVVEAARRAVNGELGAVEGEAALREILRIGSSAGGAQAKAVIGWNRATDEFLLGDRELPEGFEHWMIKFTPKEYPWRGEKEYECHLKAKACGLDVGEATLYELDGLKHFMSRRFDRDGGGVKHHLLTLSAMAHFPMSVPPEFRAYEQFLITVDRLGLGYAEREEVFRRIAFNVYIGECDDHTKNFSFRLRRDGGWGLAPAYDLTGGDFPSADPWCGHAGTHMLSVNGKFGGITDDDLLTVGDRFAIGTAPKILERMKTVLGKTGRKQYV